MSVKPTMFDHLKLFSCLCFNWHCLCSILNTIRCQIRVVSCSHDMERKSTTSLSLSVSKLFFYKLCQLSSVLGKSNKCWSYLYPCHVWGEDAFRHSFVLPSITFSNRSCFYLTVVQLVISGKIMCLILIKVPKSIIILKVIINI